MENSHNSSNEEMMRLSGDDEKFELIFSAKTHYVDEIRKFESFLLPLNVGFVKQQYLF